MNSNLKNKSEEIGFSQDMWIKIECNEVLYIISKSVRDYRKKYNLSQEELAKKIGVKQPMIAKLESSDYNPSIKFLINMWNKLSTDEENFGVDLLTKISEKIDKNFSYVINIQYTYKTEMSEFANDKTIQIGKKNYEESYNYLLDDLQEAS